MPILNSRSPNLESQGAILEVIIVPSRPVVSSLQKENKPVPSVKVIAIIDTGASCSCINQSIADALGLLPGDLQNVHTAAGDAQQFLYDVGIILPISSNAILAKQVLCANIDNQPYQVLLGRDVLSHCTLFYNGGDGSFTLHF